LDQWETQKSQRVLHPILPVIWHHKIRITDSQSKVERVKEEAHNVNPVHSTFEVVQSLKLKLLNLKSHQKQRSEQAHGVANNDNESHETIHLDEEWNEESKTVADKHPTGHGYSAFVLPVNNVSNQFLVSNITISLLNYV